GPAVARCPIPPSATVDAASRGLAVTASDPSLLDEHLATMAGADPSTPALDLELEIETGLGRGGIALADAGPAALRIARAERARLRGVWTHLQAVEDADLTALQIARFESAVDDIVRSGVDLPPRHLAA